MRVGATIVYVGVTFGVVLLANAGSGAALPIWVVASLCLGWVTRSPWSALLPLLAIPFAIPFGYPDQWTGGDPLVLWAEMLLAAPIESVFVVAAFSGQRLFQRFRASRA